MEKERKILSLLGLPGCGKGTQGELLAKKTGAKIYGMGDLIRKEIESCDLTDPFCAEIKERYDKGIPQPDEIAIDIVKKNLTSVDGDIILDNFPFTAKQSDLFFELCKQLNIDNYLCVWIKLSPESAISRILNRKICSSCRKVYIGSEETICEVCGGALISRADDKEEVVKNRISIYKPNIDEVVEVFREKGRLIEIDGEKSIAEVEKEIEDKVING